MWVGVIDVEMIGERNVAIRYIYFALGCVIWIWLLYLIQPDEHLQTFEMILFAVMVNMISKGEMSIADFHLAINWLCDISQQHKDQWSLHHATCVVCQSFLCCRTLTSKHWWQGWSMGWGEHGGHCSSRANYPQSSLCCCHLTGNKWMCMGWALV